MAVTRCGGIPNDAPSVVTYGELSPPATRIAVTRSSPTSSIRVCPAIS
jgi:hypothetical protein